MLRRLGTGLFAVAWVLQAHIAAGQGLTGSLIGSVRDVQGEVLSGAVVRLSSPSLIGGVETLTTTETGQLRFPALPPGQYALDIEVEGFSSYHDDIRIGIDVDDRRQVVRTAAGNGVRFFLHEGAEPSHAQDDDGDEKYRRPPTPNIGSHRCLQGKAQSLSCVGTGGSRQKAL